MLVHPRVTLNIKFAGTLLYTWVERGTVRVKCPAQEYNTMSPVRARTRTARSGVELTNCEVTAQNRKTLLCAQRWIRKCAVRSWQGTAVLQNPTPKLWYSSFMFEKFTKEVKVRGTRTLLRAILKTISLVSESYFKYVFRLFVILKEFFPVVRRGSERWIMSWTESQRPWHPCTTTQEKLSSPLLIWWVKLKGPY